MTKIYILEAGVDYEGRSPIKAFTTKQAAEDRAKVCYEYLATAVPYLEGDHSADEYEAWSAADDAWTRAAPEDFERYHDYFVVTEIDLVGEAP